MIPVQDIFSLIKIFLQYYKRRRNQHEFKNRKILIILIIAILVAAAGGVSLYLYLTPQKTTVYVFNSNYESGTALTEKMLTPIRCDSKIVTAGKTADVKSRFITGSELTEVLNSGDHLRMDVAEGMPLTRSELFVNGGSDIEKIFMLE